MPFWAASGKRGRLVFSSSANPIRATGTRVEQRNHALASFVVTAASGIAEILFATLFPSDCRLCSQPLIDISRLPVCQPCLSEMRPIAGCVCSICGERLLSPHIVAAEQDQPLCGLCRRKQPPFARAVAYGSYERGLRELIHLLKYEQIKPAAGALGRMLAQAITPLECSWGQAPIAVVPVPLHARKMRQRGFNQSEVIVRAALKLAGGNGRIALCCGVLERKGETQSQTGLTRHQRRENIRGAFVVTNPDLITGREVLLVDDVFTTDTTVSECARVLRRAGASRVYVATVARTLKTDAPGAPLRILAEDEEIVAAAGWPS